MKVLRTGIIIYPDYLDNLQSILKRKEYRSQYFILTDIFRIDNPQGLDECHLEGGAHFAKIMTAAVSRADRFFKHQHMLPFVLFKCAEKGR